MTTLTAAFKAERSTRRTRTRTPISVKVGRVLARVLPSLAAVRTGVISLAAYSAISYGAWLMAEPAGFVVGGLSLLIFDWQMGND